MTPPKLSWLRVPKFTGKKRTLADPPGSLVHTGTKRTETTTMSLLSYDATSFEEVEISELPDVSILNDTERVNWLNITGLHEIEKLSALGEHFQISNLILEDILHTSGRPKIEKRETDVFVVIRLLESEADHDEIDMQQLSMLLLPNKVLISFLEEPTEIFDPVLKRIRTGGGGRIRTRGADYLAWALLDAVVDNYLFVIDQLDESVSSMDALLQADSSEVEAGELYMLKRDIGSIYRSIRPIREITSSLQRQTTPLLRKTSKPFFTDLNDHAVQVMETIEDLRESMASLRDFYLAAASNRMNEVMKVLTCFSTIFLPLTFVAGVYGMNFKHMPELGYPWAYPAVWAVFLLCAGGMFWLFKRMKWL